MTAGFFRPRNQIPKYLLWIHYSSFTRYSLEALNVNEFASNPKVYRCTDGGFEVNVSLSNGSVIPKRYCPFENGDAFLDNYGFDAGNKWVDVGALCGFYVVFICLVLIFLRFVRHVKR
jgi:ABC-type multidrug transport system permease subunit